MISRSCGRAGEQSTSRGRLEGWDEEERPRVVGGVKVKGCFWFVNRFVVELLEEVVVVRILKRFTPPPWPVLFFEESNCTATNLLTELGLFLTDGSENSNLPAASSVTFSIFSVRFLLIKGTV